MSVYSNPVVFYPIALRFLIGNKADLEKLVSDESVADFAAAHDCDSAFLVSAKTGTALLYGAPFYMCVDRWTLFRTSSNSCTETRIVIFLP